MRGGIEGVTCTLRLERLDAWWLFFASSRALGNGVPWMESPLLNLEKGEKSLKMVDLLQMIDSGLEKFWFEKMVKVGGKSWKFESWGSKYICWSTLGFVPLFADQQMGDLSKYWSTL